MFISKLPINVSYVQKREENRYPTKVAILRLFIP